MSVPFLLNASGLIGVVTGVLLVNVLPSPRSAQTGAIIAGIGVTLLAISAIRQIVW